MNSKETLDKVLTVLGIQSPVAVVEPEVVLAEPIPEVEEPVKEEEEEVEEKMSVEEIIAGMEARLKSCENMIAAMSAEEVKEEVPSELLPIPTAMAKQELSSTKFNGAPVTEAKVEVSVKDKFTGTMGTVLSRLYGN